MDNITHNFRVARAIACLPLGGTSEAHASDALAWLKSSPLARLSFVAPSPTMIAVPDATIAKYLGEFSFPAFDVLERVADDSIASETERELDGVRFTFEWPAHTRYVRWCVKSAPVTGTAFVLSDGNDWPVESLTGYVAMHTMALVFPTAELALAAVAEARIQVANMGAGSIDWLWRAGPGSREEKLRWLDRLVAQPIKAAADEIADRLLPAVIARRRMKTAVS
jgi:hypothetical protein